MGKQNDLFMMILDIDRVFSEGEKVALRMADTEAASV